MLSTSHLVYKLNLQSKYLEKNLNLPVGFGKEPLAKAIYQCFNYDDLCATILDLGLECNHQYLLEHENLKYLLICIIEDGELIDRLVNHLQQNILEMADRLEKLVIINITKIQLVSILYKLFNLDYESKYLVDMDETELNWVPFFKSLTDNAGVLFTDLKINDMPFRFIATKLRIEVFSVDGLIKSIKEDVRSNENVAYGSIDIHIAWLTNCLNLFTVLDSHNRNKSPHLYKIGNQNYVVYGFPLTPDIASIKKHPLPQISLPIINTKEKQVFILNDGQQKLALESLVLERTIQGTINHSKFSQQIETALLNHKDACNLPLINNDLHLFMWVRPYCDNDLLENAL